MPAKILIVEDEKDILFMLSNRLISNGFETVTAENGAEALLAAQAEQPDLIITDVLMPEMTGYQFVENLKSKLAPSKKVPIIVISAKKSMEEFFNSWDIYSFLPKPYKNEELLDLIDKALKSASIQNGTVKEPRKKPISVSPENKPEAVSTGNRWAIIAGIDQYVLDKTTSFLENKGFDVFATTEAEKALELAAARKPAFVFVQYCEDPQKMDAETVFRKVQQMGLGRACQIVAFCRSDLKMDARQLLQTKLVIGYKQSNDLIEEISKITG